MKRQKFISHKGKLATRWKIVQNESFVCIREVRSLQEDGFKYSLIKPGIRGKLICQDDEFSQFSLEYYCDNGEVAIFKFNKKDFENCFEKVK